MKFCCASNAAIKNFKITRKKKFPKKFPPLQLNVDTQSNFFFVALCYTILGEKSPTCNNVAPKLNA